MEHTHTAVGHQLYWLTWAWLMGITVAEVGLAYSSFGIHLLLLLLLSLSMIKGALIMAHFMHLRFERLTFILTVVPALLFIVALLFGFFPEAVRALTHRV